MLSKLYKEEIYKYLAIVYHRTGAEFGKKSIDYLFNNIYSAGNGGQSYGKGLYCCYELEDQMKPHMIDTYGDYLVKMKVNLNKFLIFDVSVREKIFGKNMNLYDQSVYYGIKDKKILNFLIGMEEELKENNYTNYFDLLLKINRIDYKKFNGIVYNTSGHTDLSDGRSLVIYNLHSYIPLEYAEVTNPYMNIKNIKWKKIDPKQELKQSYIKSISGGDFRDYKKFYFDKNENKWFEIDRINKIKNEIKMTDDKLISLGIFDEITKLGTKYKLASTLNYTYGILNLKNEIILDPIYDNIGNVDENGNRKIKLDNKYGLVNSDFKIIIPPKYDKIYNPTFSGYIKTKLKNKYGFYDYNYDEILKPIYDENELKDKLRKIKRR